MVYYVPRTKAARDFGVQRFQMWNEPDLNNAGGEADFVARLHIAS
jgi:hypothetical protein